MNVRPPMRDGVSASRVQVPVGQWPSLLAFLCEHFPDISEATWQSRLARDLVLGANGNALTADDMCHTGDTVFYYREIACETEIPFEACILYQDENILIADKPHFLPVVPSGRFLQQTLLVRLKKQLALEDIAPAHRIDRDTAGLVLFTHNPHTRDAYQSLFRTRNIHKCYEAIAPRLAGLSLPLQYRNRIEEDTLFFRSRQVEGASNCETRIELIANNDTHAHYRLLPVTGRKHQLRVTMAALGAPIVNDRLYPDALPSTADDFSAPLQLLAAELQFVDPLNGELRHFASRQRLVLPA